MADKEINTLTAASQPQDGSELIHLIQGGNSRKSSIQNIDAVAKAWGMCDGTASTVNASYGVTSNTNGTAGVNTWNLSITFSSTTYGAIIGCQHAAANTRIIQAVTLAATSILTQSANEAGVATDCSFNHMSAFGDL